MWPVEKANKWYQDKGWVIGCNYLPPTAVNSTEMWQKESYDPISIDRDFAMAVDIGFNSCRVFLPFIVWEAEKDEFIATFDNFLTIANKHGITVMPILFDDCAFAGKEPYTGKQAEPIPRIHNSGWTPSPGFTIADNPRSGEILKEYVQTIIKEFTADNRILLWDLYNEPGNSGRGAKSLPLLRNAFKWARECTPTQPLTAGVWEWKEWDLECISLSDVISFHSYASIEHTRAQTDDLAKLGRPLFCTEWLHRLYNNTVETHLPFFKERGVSIYNWGFVNGKTQTHLSWNMDENPPAIWQHDLFDKDLKPYSMDEIGLIKKLCTLS